MPTSEVQQPFDLADFQAEFTQALEDPQNALRKMVDAVQQNPSIVDEILKAASAALKAAAEQHSPARAKTPPETKTL